MEKLLLVDMDPVFETTLLARFAKIGLSVDVFRRLDEKPEFDAAIVNLSLPGIDALALLASLREASSSSALFACWDREADVDVVPAYEAGADDCFPKSLDLAILEAKVRRGLRRTAMTAARATQAPERDAPPIKENDLTRFEARLLRALARTPGELVTTSAIVRELWGDLPVNPKIVYEHISTLRTKLLGVDWTIKNLRGRGYRLERSPARSVPPTGCEFAAAARMP